MDASAEPQPPKTWNRAAGRIVAQAHGVASTATSLEIIHSGDDHYGRLLAEIRSARRSVDVEMYQVRPDRVGESVLAALAAAGRRGVRVRLLVDTFGSLPAARHIAQLMNTPACVRWYNPFLPGHRTHRKLVVVDGRRACLGGMNLGEEFSESCAGRNCWRDVMLWLEGPAVRVLASQFEAAWADRPFSATVPDTAATTTVARAPVKDGIPCVLAGGSDGRSGFLEVYESLLDSARREVLIANPYVLPPHRMHRALCSAAQRGVKVVVVIPRRSDMPLFKHGARSLYDSLLASGVTLWERHDRMVHAKVAVVDGEVAAVGSVNLNPRSLTSNAETLLLTPHPPVVRDIRSLVLEEAAMASEQLNSLTWRDHPDRLPVVEALALALANIV